MATLLSPAHAPVQLRAYAHAARQLQFAGSSDGLLLFLSEECWGRGFLRLAELLNELLTERQAEQAEPPLDPELAALLPF